MRSCRRDQTASIDRIRLKKCACFLLTVMTWLSAVAVARASSRPSDAELAAITERGRLLAEYDIAAWHATDAVLAMHPKEGSFNRYIAHKAAAGWVVDFGKLTATGDKFLVAYEATQTGGPTQFTVKRFDPAREDAGWNLLAARGGRNGGEGFRGNKSSLQHRSAFSGTREPIRVLLSGSN